MNALRNEHLQWLHWPGQSVSESSGRLARLVQTLDQNVARTQARESKEFDSLESKLQRRLDVISALNVLTRVGTLLFAVCCP